MTGSRGRPGPSRAISPAPWPPATRTGGSDRPPTNASGDGGALCRAPISPPRPVEPAGRPVVRSLDLVRDDMGERPFGDLAGNPRLGAPIPQRAAEPVRRRPRPFQRPSDGLAGNRLSARSGEDQRRIGLRFGQHPQGGRRQRNTVLPPRLHPRSRDRPHVALDLGPLRPGDLPHAAGGERDEPQGEAVGVAPGLREDFGNPVVRERPVVADPAIPPSGARP